MKEKIQIVNSKPTFMDFPIFRRNDNFEAVSFNPRNPIIALATPMATKNMDARTLKNGVKKTSTTLQTCGHGAAGCYAKTLIERALNWLYIIPSD
jgi:hypothetical protein